MSRCAPPPLVAQVYLRDDFTCQDCGHRGVPGSAHGTIQAHHVIPAREGGPHTLANLITLCTACHKSRDRAMWVTTMRAWQQRLGFRNLTTE